MFIVLLLLSLLFGESMGDTLGAELPGPGDALELDDGVVYKHICIHMYVIHIYIYMHTHIYIYIYIYVHTHVHTYIYIYTHTYIYK